MNVLDYLHTLACVVPKHPPAKEVALMVWGMIDSDICGTGREPNSF
jgi:hypothetical protein